MWEGPDHRGRCHIRANDPGMYKQARCVWATGNKVAHSASASAPTFASLDGGLWSGNVDWILAQLHLTMVFYHSRRKPTTHIKNKECKKAYKDMNGGYVPFLPFLIACIFNICITVYSRLYAQTCKNKTKRENSRNVSPTLCGRGRDAGNLTQGLRHAQHTLLHWVMFGSQVA